VYACVCIALHFALFNSSLYSSVSFADLRGMILEKETELAKVNKELKDLEHYKVGLDIPLCMVCGVSEWLLYLYPFP